MFTINTSYNGIHRPPKDYFIVVNGHKCKCNKSIAEKISPIIQKYFNEKKNYDPLFTTEISVLGSSADNLNETCTIISKIFSGEEIICKENNLEILNLIGEHFEIQEILNVIGEYQQCLKITSSYFKEMIELEKILLFEIDETNIVAKINEYESLFKKIPINCVIHFIIIIGIKNYKMKKMNTNQFIIEIIKNVDQIIPNAFANFLSILYHKFIRINSVLFYDIDNKNKLEINSLIHQIFVDGLMKDMKEKIKFNPNEITIPADLQKYFNENGNFNEQYEEINDQNGNSEIIDYFDLFFEYIKNDDIDSFQNYLTFSQGDVDINIKIKNATTKRISFIGSSQKCSLIELSAFFGSIKCFKYFFNNKAKINKRKLINFAVAGGNPEIIHICENEKCVFNKKTLDISIEYHKHQITQWLVDIKNIKISEKNLRNCIIYYNIEIIIYLIQKGINISKMVFYICESNNIVLLNWLTVLEGYYKLKVIYKENKKTALHIACEQNNAEIVKLLLSKDRIDINSNYEVIIESIFH